MLPADAPLGGQAASILLSAWRASRAPKRSSALMHTVVSSRCSLHCGPLRHEALVAAAGPGGAAGVSARRLLDALRPGLLTQELAPAELWDIDTPDQLLAWRLRSSAAVSSILDLVAERQADGTRAAGCHCH